MSQSRKKERGAVGHKERQEVTEKYLYGRILTLEERNFGQNPPLVKHPKTELPREKYLFCYCNWGKKNPTFKAHRPHGNELTKFLEVFERAMRTKQADAWLEELA